VIWFLVWLVLVLAAAAVLGLLGRDLWRRSRLLVRELGAATDRLTEITDRLGDLEAARHEPGAAGPGRPASDVRSNESSAPRR
jgi:hypothetical protein